MKKRLLLMLLIMLLIVFPFLCGVLLTSFSPYQEGNTVTKYLITYLNNKIVNFKVVVKEDFPVSLNNNLIIGKRPLNSSGVSEYFFNGSIDELRIYSKPLTNLEINYLYN